MSNLLEVQSVSKTYGSTRVLNGVSFTCRPGTITGLLGPNGAGKSTLMRIMLALSMADAGTVTYGGTGYVDLPSPGASVGALLDPTAHHQGRSVQETLISAALLMGLPKSRALEVVEQFGLASVRKRNFGALSLGMKQRVSLGIALLGQPQYLILDEPVNGLDIESSAWLRKTLTDLAANGAAIVISTHLLQELQQFADQVVILSSGSVVYAGAMQGVGQNLGTVITTQFAEQLRVAAEVEGIGLEKTGTDGTYILGCEPLRASELCLTHSILVTELREHQEGLESAYLRVTEGQFSMHNATTVTGKTA